MKLVAVRVAAQPDAAPAREARRNVDAVATAYMDQFRALLDGVDTAALGEVVEILRRARVDGRTVFICGNGGSAATASHWVNDLGKATRREGLPPFRVMCLSDNVSWLTALANDEGYPRVFAGQLENFAQPGDVLMMISASGRSPNLIAAADLADERGLTTIALLGFDGGLLKNRVDVSLWLSTPIGAYGLVETGHSLLCDIVTACLAEDVETTNPDP